MAAIFKAIAKIRMVKLDSLVWSDEEYDVEEFLHEFRLPQIVQVQEGVYERTNEKTMPAGQILKLHTVQQINQVLGETSKGDEVFIPLSSPYELEIVPDRCNNVEYQSIGELFDLSPNYVRSLDTLERPQIKKGTIFELKGKTLLSSIWYAEMKNTAKPHNRVQIPLLMKARFQPLVDTRTYFLVEALNTYKFPFRVRFLETSSTSDGSADEFVTEDNRLDLPSLGVITLQDRRQESVVISTSRNGRNVTVVTFPTDLSITFSPALGLLKGESNYARICKEFHDGVDLEKIKNRRQLNAYLSKDTVQQEDLDYEEIPPLVPPRAALREPEVMESSDDVDSEEWSDSAVEEQSDDSAAGGESIEEQANANKSCLPPPRPPKPAKAMSSSSINPIVSQKEEEPKKVKPKVKPKPTSTKVAQIQAAIAQNSPSPYTAAYQSDLPPSSQHKAETIIEDSGIGLETSPTVPERTTSLQHGTVPSYPANNAQFFNEEYTFEEEEVNSNESDGDYIYPAASPDSMPGSPCDVDNEYNYIEDSEHPLKPKVKHMGASTRSRLKEVFSWPRHSGSRSQSIALKSLDDLRHVVNGKLLPSLTINQVGDCLRLLHLSEYKKAFKKKQIDGSLFASLTEQHLVDLGVTNVTDRTKLLKFIKEGWVPKI